MFNLCHGVALELVFRLIHTDVAQPMLSTLHEIRAPGGSSISVRTKKIHYTQNYNKTSNVSDFVIIMMTFAFS